MIGRRRDDGTPELALEPGDYARLLVPDAEAELRQPEDLVGYWAVNLPAIGAWKPYRARLAGDVHTVTEHEDGTITVAPSIALRVGDVEVWHGFLERGVWRAA